MGFKDFLLNVVTLGAHGRLQDLIEEYNQLVDELKTLNRKMEIRKEEVNKVLLQVVKLKKSSYNSLKRIRRITSKLNIKHRNIQFNGVSLEQIKQGFSYAENSLKTTEIALNSVQGASAGLGTAAATYFLVGQLATASTGTAIASLSGAAATNATLAWLGGGSLATGGLGIMAGKMVLGGLFLLPAVAITALLSYNSTNKKIQEVQEKIDEVSDYIYKVKQNLAYLDYLQKRSDEITVSLKKTKEVFEKEYNKIMKKLYPIPIFSRLFKSLKKLFGFNYFNEEEMKHIYQFSQIANNFAKIIDTPVIEN
ncbi:MAG TPA: hypothetical protein P5332_10015 [Ignavibacteriales bacterium]|nr:hypothetical protein [Ignavibacteriales bacterium]